MLDFAITGSEKFRCCAVSCHIEMLPAVLFARENDCVVRRPVNNSTSRIHNHIRKRILQLFATVPDLFCIRTRGIRHPNRPRMRTIRLNKVTFGRIPGDSRPAHERNLLSITRPFSIRIAVHGRRNEVNGFCAHVVYADKAVIAAFRNEKQLAAVWRPTLSSICAANE